MPYERVFGWATMQGNHAIRSAVPAALVEQRRPGWEQLSLEMQDERLEIHVEVEMKRAIEGWVGLVSTQLEEPQSCQLQLGTQLGKENGQSKAEDGEAVLF